MHGRNKEFRCDRSRSGQISARPPPIRSRNWEKTWRSGQYTPAVGMRPSGPGSGRSPSSTFLRVWRTVRSSVGRTSQPPKRSWVSFAGPGHKGIVRLPAGMSFEADGLEHPDQIVEMARVRDSAPTHAGEQLRDFQGQAPEFQRDCGGRHGDATGPAHVLGGPSAQAGPPGRAALSGTKYSTWGGGYTRKREAGAGGEMEGR